MSKKKPTKSSMGVSSAARPKTTPVTEKSIQSSAKRVTRQGSLVSAEVMYVQRQLGSSAMIEDIDAMVVAVRKMAWADIMAGIE